MQSACSTLAGWMNAHSHDLHAKGPDYPREAIHNKLFVLEQLTDRFLLVHDDVQVRARHRHVRVPRGGPHLGEGSSAGQGVADERVPAVVDGQCPDWGRGGRTGDKCRYGVLDK